MTEIFPESFTAHVKVLQHHIDRGECTDPFQCAVALALQEMFPQAPDVTVGTRSAAIDHGGGRLYRAVVPGDMGQFIDRFDDGLAVEPAEFDLTFKLQTW